MVRRAPASSVEAGRRRSCDCSGQQHQQQERRNTMINNDVLPSRRRLLCAAVAAVMGTGMSVIHAPRALAQEADEDLEEVVVTGSRIVRRDLETNSPLLTIDIQQ